MTQLMATIDYRMAKIATLRDVRKGRVSRFDVCDAHPELLRAAKHIGQLTSDICPICEKEELRLVVYTYGKALKRRNGSVRRAQELRALRREVDEFVCYVVEVCTGCYWNHLVRSFVTGRRHAG
ncbi:MAG: DUF5318 domain-containing protein [Actinobacteria bacterium]|nr:DUF5318 domain-containing protein [Actinomycetota bacterium]